MLTYQDYLASGDRMAFLTRLAAAHEADDAVKLARIADLYDRRKNPTIGDYVRRLYSLTGVPMHDFTASSCRIASNFFARLNTQRAAYSLGNGVTFPKDGSQAALGADFDSRLYEAGRLALIHGCSYLLLTPEAVHVFPMTEFAPLWDEETGRLRAGLRLWRLDESRPLQAMLYEEDGATRLASVRGRLTSVAKKMPYRMSVRQTDEGQEMIAGENYPALPIVPLWGSHLHQSTLVGMREAIDSFDLIRSGFANDLTDCAEIYWLMENYGMMTDEELIRFRDRLKLTHIAAVENGAEGKVVPYRQEVPYEARMAYLSHIREGIYEDFGALDVSRLSAGNRTATEIQAAYQPLDEEADDFEYQIILAVRALLALSGIDDTPSFKRNRIANQMEQTQLVMMEAEVLDRETLLAKLPNLTPEEAERVLRRRKTEDEQKGENQWT